MGRGVCVCHLACVCARDCVCTRACVCCMALRVCGYTPSRQPNYEHSTTTPLNRHLPPTSPPHPPTLLPPHDLQFWNQDHDGNGLITVDEFRETLLVALKVELSDREIGILVNYLDKNNDGFIDYDEFIDIYDFVRHSFTSRMRCLPLKNCARTRVAPKRVRFTHTHTSISLICPLAPHIEPPFDLLCIRRRSRRR